MVLFGIVSSCVSVCVLSHWCHVIAVARVCLVEGDLGQEHFLLHNMTLSLSTNVFWVHSDADLHRVSPAFAL